MVLNAIFGFVLLFVVALHTSIAAMETLSWLIFLVWLTQIWKQFKKISLGYDFALWGLVITVALGLLFNPNTKDFWHQFGTMRWVILIYSFTFILRSLREGLKSQVFDRMFDVWALSVVLISAYALLQAFTGIDFVHHDKANVLSSYHGIFKAVGTFSLSLTFAYMLGISTTLMFSLAIFSKGFNRFYISTAFGLLGLGVSLARGAWLGILVSMVLLLFLRFGKKMLVPTVAAIPAGLFGLSFVPGVYDRLLTFTNIFSDSSVNTRFSLWKAYWHVFLDHPFFGVGIFNGKFFLEPYYEKFQVGYRLYSHAHNNWLYALVGTGLIGTGLLLIWNFHVIESGIKAFKLSKNTRERAILAGILAAQVFWQLGGLTECNFTDGEVNHMIIFTWALLLSYRRCEAAMTT